LYAEGFLGVREIGLYVFFGLLTTAVNMLAFQILEGIFRRKIGARSYWVSNPAAWAAAVAFAFAANKLWVFGSASWEAGVIAREFPPFVLARLLSLGLEQGLMAFFFTFLWKRVCVAFEKFWRRANAERAYRFIVKLCVIQALVVAMNYVFSKYFIFVS
jgi:putative flippase GtrA